MPGRSLLAAAMGALVCSGCGDDPVRPPDPDYRAPLVTVLSPTAGTYDTDGDALVDLRLSWTDSAGSVDPQSVRVRTLRDGTGVATPGYNLLEHWRVERVDSLGLVAHETFDALLPRGTNSLEIMVADTAGNVSGDTIVFDLPYAAVTKTLDSGSRQGHIVEAIYCADDNRIYMTAGDNVLAIDPDSLRITADFLASKAAVGARDVLCFEDEASLYVSGTTVMLYHRTTHENTADILGAYSARAMAPSRVDPDLLYVGYEEAAVIGLISRSQRRHIGLVPMEFTTGGPYDFISGMAVMPGDEKIYINRGMEGGILVVDPVTGEIRKRIDLTGPLEPWDGRADRFSLSADDRYLYAAVIHGIPRGVYRIRTDTDEVDATIALAGRTEDLELSPDGSRIFATTQDLSSNSPSRNVLIDVKSWTVLQEFDRPRADGEIRHDGGIVFHPTLPLFFVGRDRSVDVYLDRR